jgi:hypothetical protein
LYRIGLAWSSSICSLCSSVQPIWHGPFDGLLAVYSHPNRQFPGGFLCHSDPRYNSSVPLDSPLPPGAMQSWLVDRASATSLLPFAWNDECSHALGQRHKGTSFWPSYMACKTSRPQSEPIGTWPAEDAIPRSAGHTARSFLSWAIISGAPVSVVMRHGLPPILPLSFRLLLLRFVDMLSMTRGGGNDGTSAFFLISWIVVDLLPGILGTLLLPVFPKMTDVCTLLAHGSLSPAALGLWQPFPMGQAVFIICLPPTQQKSWKTCKPH